MLVAAKTKMWVTILLALNIFLVTKVNAGYFPTKCVLSDSDCVTKAAQDFIPTFTAGIPDIGLEPSDPLYIQRVDASNNILSLILTDVYSTGLKDTIVKRVRFDESKLTLTLKLLVTYNLESQYEMSGSLLFLPLNGNGPLHVKLRKTEINLLFNYMEVTGKDGKPHWYFKYKNHTYSLNDRCDVVFENLFKGNQLLANTAKEVISRSGNEIIQEVGSPVIKAVIDGIVIRINKLFGEIPVDEARA